MATEVDDVQLNFDEKATQRSSKTLLNNVEETLNKIIIGEDASNEETIEEATAVHEDSAKLNPSSFKTDEYGFPLSIFTKVSYCWLNKDYLFYRDPSSIRISV